MDGEFVVMGGCDPMQILSREVQMKMNLMSFGEGEECSRTGVCIDTIDDGDTTGCVRGEDTQTEAPVPLGGAMMSPNSVEVKLL